MLIKVGVCMAVVAVCTVAAAVLLWRDYVALAEWQEGARR